MGPKARTPPVRVELDLELRGAAVVVLDEAAAEHLALRVARGEPVTVRELGLHVDWNELARPTEGGLIVGCEAMERLS